MLRKALTGLFFLATLTACEEIFEVTDISEEQVTLLAPTNESTLTTSSVSFNWDGVAEADAYLVQIATPNFENATQFVLDTIVVVDSTFVGNRLIRNLTDNTYQWRVQAQNSDFATGFSTASFTVATGN
ncbi:hypothetical protein ABV409_14990 [Flagellimonas sp. DF-77]|uniref:hypothetical protein n=1 Tax=Flagellimonas algarum TaxID=3230298 RepID=UPI00339AE6A8